MPFEFKSFADMLSAKLNSWAGLLGLSPNLPSGDPMKAFFQASTLAGDMYLQRQAKLIYLAARASTCVGPDLDSFVADYGLKRQLAVQALGVVTLSLKTVSGSNIIVQPGAIVQNVGGTIQYSIIIDVTKQAWQPAQNAYVLPAGDLSIDVAVQAVNAGTASNVQPAVLTQLASSLPGIYSVSNTAPILNGTDPESDPALRARFKLFVAATNANGTIAAFRLAAANTRPDLDIAIVENQDYNGIPIRSYVLVIIDDGSGAPSQDLLNQVYLAVDAIRGAGVEIAIVGPTTTLVPISLNIRAAAGYVTSAANTAAINAVIAYVNSLTISGGLEYNDLIYIARATPAVGAVQPQSLLVNGGVADLASSPRGLYRTNNTLVTVGNY